MAKQDDLEDVPADKLAALEAEHKALEEEVRSLGAEVKMASSGKVSRKFQLEWFSERNCLQNSQN